LSTFQHHSLRKFHQTSLSQVCYNFFKKALGMESLLSQILDLLTTPPGSLIYHLVLAFAITSALQFSLAQSTQKRTSLGLSILLLLQLLLFLAAALFWQGLLNPLILLPPLERFITFLSLLWVTWLWAYPSPKPTTNIAFAIASLVTLIGFLFTLNLWPSLTASLAFNNSWFDWGWQLAGLFVILLGITLLLIRRPQAWGVGLAFFLLSGAGILAHLLLSPANQSTTGFIRLAQLCSYPLLPALLQRQHAHSSPSVTSATSDSANTETPRKRNSAEPRTVQAWLELANEQTPDKLGPALAHAISQTMLADLCLIVSAPDPFGQVIIQCGYDLIREEPLPGAVLEQRNISSIANALQRGKPMRIIPSANNTPTDLQMLTNAIGLREPGPMLCVPIFIKEQPWGAIILLSPYSNRAWNTEDQSFLIANSEPISRVIQRALGNNTGQINTQDLENELRQSNEKLLRAIQEQQALQEALQRAEKSAQRMRPEDEFQALLAVQQETQQALENLEAENRQLRATISEMQQKLNTLNEDQQLESELRLTLGQVAHLQNLLAEANIKILNLQRQVESSGALTNEDREVIASIVQELRQPLSSILGYSELLLGESVGILGTLQRKFLERIKNSTERMRTLLEDLLQYTTMQAHNIDLIPETIDLNEVIDQAINETSGKLREKGINLRVDIPEEMPKIYADQEALQQVMIHLLQNAGTVTPAEGNIRLSVKITSNEDQPYLLFQVTDSGGGISADELSRVFSRRYRADNPVIQGVGDNGVGLSIAKTLVEAHGGRIWVESDYGTSSTFSVLLPIHPK
jgi:signal transduction histidine kinase